MGNLWCGMRKVKVSAGFLFGILIPTKGTFCTGRATYGTKYPRTCVRNCCNFNFTQDNGVSVRVLCTVVEARHRVYILSIANPDCMNIDH